MKHLPFELRMEIYDLIDPKNVIFAELQGKNNDIIKMIIIPNRYYDKKLKLNSTIQVLYLNEIYDYNICSQDSILKTNTFRESFVKPFFTRLRKNGKVLLKLIYI